MSELSFFIHEHHDLVWWLAVASGAVFVGSLVLVPWLVVRIPADYFVKKHPPKLLFDDEHPLLRWTALIIKNLIGGLLVLAGLAMILLPGQGLLTIAIGVLLLDFPGKHKLKGKIIRRKPIAKSINWLRAKAGVEPLQIEPEEAHDR